MSGGDLGPVAFAPSIAGEIPEPTCPKCGVALTRFNRSQSYPLDLCKGCDAELARVREEDA